MAGEWREVCSACGRTWRLEDLRWCCACGGLLDLVGPLGDAPPGAGAIDLGMAVTRLVPAGPDRYLKLELEQPTGSFKDRGASVMIGAAAALGVPSVVVDSSGNAGKSAAAHAARAGLACTVYVPAGTAPEKIAAITAYRGRVIEVPGGRSAAAVAAQDAVTAAGGREWYASHVHQPLFHHGVKTLAFELYEQLPGLEDGTVVVPVGNGTLVLGLWIGFGELVAAGRLSRRPALVGVQAERCAPLVGPGSAGSTGYGPTAAAGIAVPDPPRAAQVRAAVLASGGRILAVSEVDIAAAGAELARLGFPVEPTAAVGWAARSAIGAPGPTVVVLTGR
jgi:threonine synthase